MVSTSTYLRIEDLSKTAVRSEVTLGQQISKSGETDLSVIILDEFKAILHQNTPADSSLTVFGCYLVLLFHCIYGEAVICL